MPGPRPTFAHEIRGPVQVAGPLRIPEGETMRKLLQEAKAFVTVIGLAALGAAIVGGIMAWEATKWSDCLAAHNAVYCAAARK